MKEWMNEWMNDNWALGKLVFYLHKSIIITFEIDKDVYYEKLSILQ